MEKIELGEWSVSVSRWDRAWQPQMESLFCQGNGYLGVRGAVDEPVPGRNAIRLLQGRMIPVLARSLSFRIFRM